MLFFSILKIPLCRYSIQNNPLFYTNHDYFLKTEYPNTKCQLITTQKGKTIVDVEGNNYDFLIFGLHKFTSCPQTIFLQFL